VSQKLRKNRCELELTTISEREARAKAEQNFNRNLN